MDNDADIGEKIQAARSAGRAWEKLSVARRVRHVRALRHRLADSWRELAGAVRAEVGRPHDQVLASEILPTASALKYLQARAAKILRPRHIPLTQRPLWLFGEHDTVYRRPRGVVGVIGTWNYPIFLNLVQIAQALTAGNAVVWKPSEVVPDTSAIMARLFGEVGLPPGLVSVLPADREFGPRLAEADVDHVVFTGSAEVGRRLAARLGERLVSSTLELSGCDAMFVLADADAKLAARSAWFGATLNNGQTCIAVRRAFVHRDVLPEFLARLKPLAGAAAPVKLALDSQREQAERLVREALAAGARRLVEFPSGGGAGPEGLFRPTVLTDVTPEMAVCREASFAPLMAVLGFDDANRALGMDAKCPYGLAASVFTRHQHSAERLARRLKVGVVTVNDVIAPTAHPATPFGGRRDSGWGVTQGAEGLLEMTVPQVVGVRSGSFRPHLEETAPDDPALTETLEGVLRFCHGKGLLNKWRGLRQQMRGGRGLRQRRDP